MFFVTCFEKFLTCTCPVIILLAFKNDPYNYKADRFSRNLVGTLDSV